MLARVPPRFRSGCEPRGCPTRGNGTGRVRGRTPWRRAPRSTSSARGFAQDEPVASLVPWRGGVDAEHPLVQDPERVEGRRAALRVLLIAGREGDELADVIEVGTGRHRGDGTTSRAPDGQAVSTCRSRRR